LIHDSEKVGIIFHSSILFQFSFSFLVIGFSIYNIAVTGLLIICTVSLVELDQASITVLMAIGILWGSFFSSLSFVLPRLLQVQRERKSSILVTSSNSSLRGNSSKNFHMVDHHGKANVEPSNNFEFDGSNKPKPITEGHHQDEEDEFNESITFKLDPFKPSIRKAEETQPRHHHLQQQQQQQQQEQEEENSNKDNNKNEENHYSNQINDTLTRLDRDSTISIHFAEEDKEQEDDKSNN
jgi:hypothetical protein